MDGDSDELLSGERLEEFVRKVSIRTPGVQEYIAVSKDRAMLVFTRWKDRIRSRDAWQAPAALVVSFTASLTTASFSDFSWIRSGTIKEVFVTF